MLDSSPVENTPSRISVGPWTRTSRGWSPATDRGTYTLAALFTYPAHVCSSLVYDRFLYADVNLIPGQEGVLVTPDDLAASPLLEPADD